MAFSLPPFDPALKPLVPNSQPSAQQHSLTTGHPPAPSIQFNQVHTGETLRSSKRKRFEPRVLQESAGLARARQKLFSKGQENKKAKSKVGFTIEKSKLEEFKRKRSSQQSLPPKAPLIIFGQFHFRENKYPVDKIGEGFSHKVCCFVEGGVLEFDGQEIDLSEAVMRYRNPLLNPKILPNLIKNDIQAYESCLEKGIPLPKCFIRPDQFQDPANEQNGGFWLMEKMAKPVSCASWEEGTSYRDLDADAKKLLGFVKLWLDKSIAEEADIVHDFFPKNVMWSAAGELCVVDFSLCKDSNWKEHIKEYVSVWSKGNASVKEYLEEGFPDYLKS